MKDDSDIVAVALQLVNDHGSDAPTISRNRLVEVTAAGNARAARFWRAVRHACEHLLTQRGETATAAPLRRPSATPLPWR
ncbi:hypothetical protein [Oleisolibacter albus]|uniref:hypothetical protein n=1 Tax=Oleisolibacter albus TaxID=2171757 RepID=UPI0012D7CA12|nr:hypothetical protein [Oleisolibacter albus]